MIDRTVEAVVLAADALGPPPGGAAALRRRLEALVAAGVSAAVTTGASAAHSGDLLRSRPAGPGRLLLVCRHGGEVYELGPRGPVRVGRRVPSAADDAALDRAVTAIRARLDGRGVVSRRVPGQVGRRVVGVRWPDRARLAGPAAATLVRDLAAGAVAAAGLPDVRVSAGATHVDVSLADRGDAMRDLLVRFASRGIGPGLVLVAGDFAHTGDDTALLVPELDRAVVVSVGAGRPGGRARPAVRHRPGGWATVLALLDEQLDRRRSARVPCVDEDPAWVVVETGADRLRHRVTETLFTLGAGGLATRGSVEEDGPEAAPLTVADGRYTARGPAQHLLPGPQWAALDIDPPPAADRRVLDLRTGVLYRQTGEGGPPIRTLRLVSADSPGLAALCAEGPAGRLTGGAPLRAPAAGPRSDGRSWTTGDAGGCVWGRTADAGTGAVITAAAVQAEAVAGGLRTVSRFAVFADRDAAGRARRAARRGFARVLAEHRAAWALRWEDVDIRIPDAPADQLAIRFALFHLWGTAARHDECAVGARGLSGTGYGGHVFWDADAYVLPAVVSIDPDAATAMVRYRLRRLPAARAAARAAGRRGARFPWESAVSGDDVTPNAGYLGGTRVPIRTGELEEHITADVAWAAVHAATWTGTPERLTGEWAPLLTETARYWASRIRLDAGGNAHIDRVIGPDEYHEDVDDNAYTNVMARWNLRAAADLAAVPDDERAGWRELAGRLADGFDPATGRYEQFAGYRLLAPLRAADVGEPPVAADVLLGRARVAASQLIKQPDVLMLHHLVPDETATGSLGPNLDFYLPRTTHGSSLSPAVSAALLARAGRPDEALHLLRHAMDLDLGDTTGTTAGGLHVAALGGVWQAVVAGFAGVRVRGSVVHLDPCPPAAWPRFEVRFRCLGRRIRVAVDAAAVAVHTDAPTWLQVGGSPPRRCGGWTRFPRRSRP
ncbi:glycoside hydrolase family 65 protein [Spirilliplanes yamanashiensis]|uniref:Uncharacterized protein n=1 Tax=Spirilliplanes yamanashiensis TaxID=42233 RepID=A0A8J3Y728_9ACTN|nr:glycoside hydrolase family 65 protein [Spirilliplanes yamanashiensis]MDP9817266.1 trehalose/maltose hydrolase-like predicted phosphorylase [Spirilliplanes yamanashiensis]GIJ03081.1 hypothetical protein Sya03_24330 [Spirilliplanes yamanashiensis]